VRQREREEKHGPRRYGRKQDERETDKGRRGGEGRGRRERRSNERPRKKPIGVEGFKKGRRAEEERVDRKEGAARRRGDKWE